MYQSIPSFEYRFFYFYSELFTYQLDFYIF